MHNSNAIKVGMIFECYFYDFCMPSIRLVVVEKEEMLWRKCLEEKEMLSGVGKRKLGQVDGEWDASGK